MSLGAELVSAVLDTGELQPLLDAGFTNEWLDNPDSGSVAVFSGDDYEAYKYILEHWDKHQRVITRKLFDRNFPPGTYQHGEDTEVTVAELLEIAQKETRRAVVQLLLAESADLVQQDRIDQAIERLGQVHQQGLSVRSKVEYRIWKRTELDHMPEPESLIDNYLHLGSLVSLFGRYSTAKSFLALDWACHVATNRPWQSNAVHKRKIRGDEGEVLKEINHRVLFIAAEGGLGQRKRIKAWESAYNNGKKIKNVDFIVVPIQVTEEAALAFLARAIRDEAYGLVVLDTQARATVGMEENSATDMGIVVEALYKLRDAYQMSGTSIVVIHHAGKDGRDRGSSAVPGAVDVQYKLEEEKDRDDDVDLIPGPFRMTCSKPPKDSEIPPSVEIYLREEEHSLVIEDNTAAQKAAKHGAPAPDKPKAVPEHKRKTRIYQVDYAIANNISDSQAYRRLSKLVKDGTHTYTSKSQSDERRAYWEKIPGAGAIAAANRNLG